MIKKIPRTFQLSQVQRDLINALKPFDSSSWDKSSISNVKSEIYNQLSFIQDNYCCYCGLKLNEGGRGELDHIAKKGGDKRPAYVEYVFTEKNLAVSCQYCNSSSKKGQEDVLINIDRVNYANCTFKIVHPYNDDPRHHYSWTNGTYKILISGISSQGRFSIQLFDLDQEPHTLARAKQAMFEKKLRRYQNYQLLRDRVLQILSFNR